MSLEKQEGKKCCSKLEHLRNCNLDWSLWERELRRIRIIFGAGQRSSMVSENKFSKQYGN